LQHICEHLRQIDRAELIFIFSGDDARKYRLEPIVKLLAPGARVIIAEGKTAGAALSCMLAIDYLDEDMPVAVAGGDQITALNLQHVIDSFKEKDLDGGVVCFNDVHPRWSYVLLDEKGLVIEAAEKPPISRNATTGFYYYKRAGDFTDAVFQMIKKKASVNGKYYVCPAYNELALKHKRIGAYFVDKERYFNLSHQKGVQMYEEYLKNKRAVNNERSETE
jgi:dTDP-glucose pyrophosphorylase